MFNLIYTRPSDRGQNIESEIIHLGFNLIKIPCIEFVNNFQGFNAINNIKDYDLYIFTSLSAIDTTIEYLKKQQIKIDFLNNKSYTVGKISSERLKYYGVANPKSPYSGTTSEDLFAIEELKDINDKKILLIRGDVSRGFINEYLKNNKYFFNEVIVYRTKVQKNLNNDILNLLSINTDSCNAILFTSQSIIDNFINAVINNIGSDFFYFLKNFIVIVPSDRLELYARSRGFNNIYNSKEMSDSAIINILKKIKESL